MFTEAKVLPYKGLIIGTLAAGLVLALLYATSRSRTHGRVFPPRMTTAALDGETFDYPWRKYARVSRKLGSLFLLDGGGQPTLIINTYKAVFDLLHRRPNFGSKPRWPMAELLGRQNNVGFSYWGDRHRRLRAFLNHSLNPSMVREEYSASLEEMSAKLVSNVWKGEDFWDEVPRNVQDMIFLLTYGRSPTEEYLALASKVIQETSLALRPGRWFIDRFPILRPVVMWVPSWIPGANFQRWVKDARMTFERVVSEPFAQTRGDMENNRATPCFVERSIHFSSLISSSPNVEADIMYASGSLFSAGTDTVISGILTGILLLSNHPDVQARAFAEISKHVGTDRLPNVDDMKALRYLDCVIQECFRFNPPVPLVAHSNISEDVYEGMTIPNRSFIIANVWAMHYDQDVYPDPQSFNPDRFYSDAEDDGMTTQMDPRKTMYGFGPRRCPGLHVANTYVFLVLARLVSLFEILPEVKGGKSCPAPLDFEVGMISNPKRFGVQLALRPHGVELLQSYVSA